MISTCLRYTQRKGGGDPRPVARTRRPAVLGQPSSLRPHWVGYTDQLTVFSVVILYGYVQDLILFFTADLKPEVAWAFGQNLHEIKRRNKKA
jgi:hypothetical protein